MHQIILLTTNISRLTQPKFYLYLSWVIWSKETLWYGVSNTNMDFYLQKMLIKREYSWP